MGKKEENNTQDKYQTYSVNEDTWYRTVCMVFDDTGQEYINILSTVEHIGICIGIDGNSSINHITFFQAMCVCVRKWVCQD